jgi:hypothetical protein
MGPILLWPNPFLAAVTQHGLLSFSFYFITTTGKIELFIGHNNFRRLEGKPM